MIAYDNSDTPTELTTTRYYYDGQRVLLETTYVAATETETDQRYFVYGNYIDEVLLMADVDSNNGITDGDYTYAHDHLYSVAALYDASGAVVERYEYDAYGKANILTPAFSVLSSSQYANPYTFTGRRLDTLDPDASGQSRLNLMYYRARTYDPQTGRFMQRDPLGYVDGMNSYGYVNSSPCRYFDPFGLYPWDFPGTKPTWSLKGCAAWCAWYAKASMAPFSEKGCFQNCARHNVDHATGPCSNPRFDPFPPNGSDAGLIDQCWGEWEKYATERDIPFSKKPPKLKKCNLYSSCMADCRELENYTQEFVNEYVIMLNAMNQMLYEQQLDDYLNQDVYTGMLDRMANINKDIARANAALEKGTSSKKYREMLKNKRRVSMHKKSILQAEIDAYLDGSPNPPEHIPAPDVNFDCHSVCSGLRK